MEADALSIGLWTSLVAWQMPVIADTQDIRPAKPAAPRPPRRSRFQLAATADEAAVLRYLLVKPFEKFWRKLILSAFLYRDTLMPDKNTTPKCDHIPILEGD